MGSPVTRPFYLLWRTSILVEQYLSSDCVDHVISCVQRLCNRRGICEVLLSTPGSAASAFFAAGYCKLVDGCPVAYISIELSVSECLSAPYFTVAQHWSHNVRRNLLQRMRSLLILRLQCNDSESIRLVHEPLLDVSNKHYRSGGKRNIRYARGTVSCESH